MTASTRCTAPSKTVTAGGGEVLLTGLAVPTEPTDYMRDRGWIAFELLVGEIRATRFNHELGRPETTRWTAE